MTHQVSLPGPGATPAPERTSSTPGAPFRSLFVYGMATMLIAAAVTIAAVVVSRGDTPSTSGGYTEQYVSELAAGYAARVQAQERAEWAAAHGERVAAYAADLARQGQLVTGIDPATDVPGAVGLSRPAADGSFQANETARMQALVDGIEPATDVPGIIGTSAADGSFQANEAARMLALAPVLDTSFQANETARMQALVDGIEPATDVPAVIGTSAADGSFQANETARMLALTPVPDISFQANETARMQGLAPFGPEPTSSFSSWHNVR